LKGSKDCAANQFSYLGDDCVSEGFKSVCPVGNPISHSTHVGFSAPDVSDTTIESINCLPLDNRRWIAGLDRLPLSLSSPAHGVGHIDRATSRSKFGNFAFAVFSVKFAAIALQERGVGHSLTAVPSPKLCRPEMPFLSRSDAHASEAVGVGQDPNAIPAVRCAKVGSWYAMPFRIIPERGQGSENVCKPSTKQCCDVFQDDVSGCQFANQTGDFVEQTAALSGKPCALPCGADVLTWEPAADDIDGNSIGSKSLCGKGADIIVTGDIGPVLGEDFARERFDFAEGDGLETACSFKAKAKPSDAREKIEDAELFHSPHPVFVRSITHTPAEERAKRLAVQVRGEVREGVGEGHAAASRVSSKLSAVAQPLLMKTGHSLTGMLLR
jgi:hypothetical protein